MRAKATTKTPKPRQPPIWVFPLLAAIAISIVMSYRFMHANNVNTPTAIVEGQGVTLAPGQSTTASIVYTAMAPCTLGRSTPLHEVYTARLIWWAVTRNYPVTIAQDSENDGNAHVNPRYGMLVNPCESSLGRLATVLHEAGHMLQPPAIKGVDEGQVFADAVARQAAERLGLDLVASLPHRQYARALVASVEGEWSPIIADSAKLLAQVARGQGQSER